MLKGILIGLTVLVLCVFGYVGYSSYLAGKSAPREEIYTGANPSPADRPQTEGLKGALPAIPSTGSDPGVGAPLTSQASVPTGGMTPPMADSIVPNPPNGMTFGGSGHYQLYRQGDLTWRLNTDNGDTCVIFATNEEWRKPKVYRAGCGKR